VGRVQHGERYCASVRQTRATVLLIALLWIAGSWIAGVAVAQQGGEEGQKPTRSWARQHEIDPLTGKRLLKAQEFLVAGQWDEADAILDKLRVRSLNPREKTKFYSLRAYVAYGRGELSVTREFLELTIAEDFAPLKEQADFRFQIAQISMEQGKWDEAIANLNKWFLIESNPNSTAYFFLALAHWQVGDIDAALEPALKSVAMAEEPQESWLKLLLAIRLTRKEYQETIPLLNQMIRRYPKKIYWIQLSTLHGVLGNYKASLIPLQLAYTQGLLTENSELRRLAELLLYLELPYRAADVMTSGLDESVVDQDSENFELLSNSWIMAREYDKAVDPLLRAAELADGGRIYHRLAEVHIQRERWQQAAEALSLALEKGSLPNLGKTTLLMGIVLYSQKKSEQALDWFDKAKSHADSEHEANIWLEHIQREMTAS